MKTANGIEKPLAEWTLKDLKELCDFGHTRKCNDCQLMNIVCQYSPCDWKLEEKPKFTEQEIEDAKAVKRILGDGYIRRTMWDSIQQLRLVKTHSYYVFEKDLFPSIKVGEKYKLDEIIGDSNA